MFTSDSNRFVKGRKPNRKPARRGVRPTVENLELRIVPSTIPQPDHVVVVMEENHAYSQIIGNSAASYINNTLVPEGALMTNSFGITHPSLPNYLDIFSGSNQGITGDVFPIPGAPFSAPSLGGELIKAGFTFGSYAESLPSVGSTAGYSPYPYDHDHAPWNSFADIPSQFLDPFQGYWPSDYTKLPAVSFVTPNLLNDMHDGTIAQGDAWLQQNIDSYAQWAKTHNSLLIVQWDESDGSQNNQVATIFVGQGVVPGQYSEQINHFNILRTIEDMYRLPYAGASATATPITDIWATTVVAPPAAPGNLTATATSSSQINLTWTDNDPNNESGFLVEGSTDGTNFTQIASLGVHVTSFSNTGLAANSKHYYRVRAFNSAGNSGYSNVTSATTLLQQLPAAPGNLTATAASSTQINLTWTDNAAGNENGFVISRSTDGVTFSQVATVGTGVTSYKDSGLTASTSYSYEVQATNAVGASANSNVASATTLATPQPPAAPGNLGATAVSSSEIDLSWTDNAPGNEAGFLIDRSLDGVTFTQIATVATGVTTYKNTGLTSNTTYSYKVQATNSVGTSTFSNVTSAATLNVLPPAPPSNLAATAVSSSSINLSWTDNAPGNETGFIINRSTDGVTFSQIATVGTGIKTYSDTGLAANSKYFYEVAATNASGPSAFSNVTSATTSASQATGPVTSLHYTPNANFVNGQYVPAQDGFNLADASSLSEVNSLPAGDKALVWLGMGDGVTSAFTSAVQPFIGNPKVYGFYLVDEPDPTGQWGPLVNAPNLKAESDWIHANDPGAKTFIVLMNMGTETNPSFANTYNSANTGIDLFGLDPYPIQKQFNGANYSIIAATVQAAEAWGITQSQIVPVYQAFGDGTTWVMPTASQEQQILAAWAPLVPQPAFDYAYSWGVQNNDTALVGSSSLQTVFAAHNAAQVSLPAAPSNLTASAVSTSEIDLAWTNNAGNASGFVVNRSTDGVNFSQLAVLGSVTSFKDTGLSAGSKCYYEVAATSAAGSSAFSNMASATTTAALSAPAAPSNLTASAVSTSEIDLAWTNNAGNATGFVVKRSTDGVNFSQLAVLGNVTSFKDTGLNAGSKCYYEVAATNAAGSSAFSNVASATTTAALTAPAAPSNLAATAVSSSQINLTWTNNASNATGIAIQRSSDGINFTAIAAVGSNVSSYQDTGLAAGGKCYYRVQASNAAGSSAFCSVASATTLSTSALPAAPSNLTARTVSTSEVDLTWKANSTNADSFRVQRSTDGIHYVRIAIVSGNVTTYNDTGLTPGISYYYRVRAANAVGFSAYSNVVTATTATPVALTLTTNAMSGGVLVNLAGTFTDPDASSSETHQVTISWGDGSALTTQTLAGGVLNFNGLSHLYASSGLTSKSFLLTITITDAGGLDAVISKLITLTF